MTKNCERYDVASDRWYEIKSIPVEAFSMSLLYVENKFIYAFGGGQRGQNDAIQRYNIETDVW